METNTETPLIAFDDLTDQELATLRRIADVLHSAHPTSIRHQSGRIEGLLTKSGGPLKGRPITRAEIYEDAV